MLSVLLPTRPDISSTSPTVVAEREKRGFEMGVPFCVEMQCAGVRMQKGRERERERRNFLFKGMPSRLAGMWENDHSYVLLVEI